MIRLMFLIWVLCSGSAMAENSLPADVAAFTAANPPCNVENNVDTCWLRGLDYLDRDPATALLHFEMSCAFRSQLDGCYKAAKLYLLEKSMRNYQRANLLFSIVCSSDEIGIAPYACKYLGWMHLTGNGAQKDDARALAFLEQSCFTPSNNPFVDAEGCELLGEFLIATRNPAQNHRAFLAFTMGCLEQVTALCTPARQIACAATVRSDAWIGLCDLRMPQDAITGPGCAGLPRFSKVINSDPNIAWDERQALRNIVKLQVLYLNEEPS